MVKAPKKKRPEAKKVVVAKALASAPISPTTIGSAAMLVCVAVHRFGNRKVEHDLAEQTAKEQEAQSGTFHTSKRLIAKEAMAQVSSAFSRFKAHHYENTLPWLDSGYRILPSANYLVYIEGARKLMQEALDEVETFMKVYPSLREAARKTLGKAFKDDDYPNEAELRRRWGIDMHFCQLPDKADFRVDLPEEELKFIRGNIDGQVASALDKATQDLFHRLYEVIEHMRNKLADYEVTEVDGKRKVEKSFRDSTIRNIASLCEMLPRLNFTNNPDLARIADEAMKKLGGQDPEALREDETMRNKTVEDADDILGKMKDFLG